MIANALTIAGSDPSGGAGIQADHKTFAAHGVYGCSVITACTAQSPQGVSGVHQLPPSFVVEQLRTLLADVRIDGCKTGMLADAAIVHTVASFLASHSCGPIVVDPVMVATSGHRLLSAAAEQAMRRELLPLATMITPNLPEAAVLLQATPPRNEAEMAQALHALAALGPRCVYLKGGHLPNNDIVDLFYDGINVHRLSGPRIRTGNTHGTGCTLAAALTAHLARGTDPLQAAQASHAWLRRALEQSEQLTVGSGQGHGPVNHLAPV